MIDPNKTYKTKSGGTACNFTKAPGQSAWQGEYTTPLGNTYTAYWTSEGKATYGWSETNLMAEVNEPTENNPSPLPFWHVKVDYITFIGDSPEDALQQVTNWLKHNDSKFLPEDDLIVSIATTQCGKFTASFTN